MSERSNNNKSSRRTKQAPIDTSFGHLQPQATDIEKVVLGALMIDKDAFTVVSEIIKPETFYESRHEKIYEAIQSLNLQQKPVDIMTVVEELRHKGTLEDVGGPAYVVELSSNVASSAHIEYHAHILAQKFLARQLIQFASMVETDAFDETVDVDELMQKAEGALFEISQKNMLQDYVQIDSVVEQAHQLLLKAANNKGSLTGVPSGFHDLDKITAGWQASDLIIIAGRPAMGKTSFALSIAKNIAIDYRKPIAFFSLEMNNVQLVNRLISNVCSVPGNKILNGQLTPDEWERFDSNIRKMQGAPIYIDDTPGIRITEIRSRARKLSQETGNLGLILIDYLQLITGTGRENRQQEVSEISRQLKILAKELKVPVIALSQLSRGVEQRQDKRPVLSDIRESGSIEQDADIVAFLYRDDYYERGGEEEEGLPNNKVEVIIEKNRSGARGTVELIFQKEYNKFSSISKREEQR